jgi:hypothetical protein
MKDLFICSGGINRSRMAVSIASQMAFEKKIGGYEAIHWGIYSEDAKRVSPEALQGFDRFFVMEPEMVGILIGKYEVSPTKIWDLRVEDIPLHEKEAEKRLRAELTDKIRPYF